MKFAKLMVITIFMVLLWSLALQWAAIRIYAKPERTTQKITLTPDQIKKAVCEGM